MADREHLEIIKQGVEVWNEWRAEHPEVQSDFRGADLEGADLTSADLASADLARANLSHADLSGADLRRADLRGADLRAADLSGADLRYADLGSADLRDAILSDAILSGAYLFNIILSDAILIGADFTDAMLGYTTFANEDLSQVKGLEAVDHFGPSSIGINTIYKSGGEIPEVFLRGCGVPEDFITYMRSLVVQPIQFYSCFISYSSKDQDFANRLHVDLQSSGVRCWFAPEDIKIGDRFRTRIDESIRVYDKLLLVLSENSVASSWVEKEVETAMEREVEDEKHRTTLFPVRLDDAVMRIKTGWPADVHRTRHIGDFTGWKNHDSYQKALDRLLRDLKAGE
jgi:hypothetical protein